MNRTDIVLDCTGSREQAILSTSVGHAVNCDRYAGGINNNQFVKKKNSKQ